MTSYTLKQVLLAATLAVPITLQAATATLLGWNNLGMHCMDSDYSVFSILPPYNTIEAQLIVGGKLVTNGVGYTLTYQAISDPDGSFNATAMGKGNFYSYAASLYGATLAPETGLAGWAMPGASNTPQAMLFEATNHPALAVATRVNWFRAEGIPISPYDDASKKNPYPLMLLVARDASKTIVATNSVVLPVSDEMDCRVCHASGALNLCRPNTSGWVWNDNPERDYRLNILRYHDDVADWTTYPDILAQAGYNRAGLYRTVVADGQPILCARCHLSEALQGSGLPGVSPLTTAVHRRHANTPDPDTGVLLGDASHRSACYRCHPGSTTRCLRGAMGKAIAADGSMAMQCQSCHGQMSTVGSTNRVGWFMEPNCQSCHTGTAIRNNGQIRYPSAFEANGSPRVAVDPTFATTPNTPAAGLSLFRFSAGHGGLQCEACHGSTHAEFPSSHTNDNLRNLQLPFQNHIGVVSECLACHTAMPATINGGPHGLHPISQNWVSTHHDVIGESGSGSPVQCQTCHGTDYRGTVLSRAQADRNWSIEGRTISLFRGAQIGCYTCHQGPFEGDRNPSIPPTVSNCSTNTISGQAVAITLPASGNGITLRIISQPVHGSVGLSNFTATYFADPGFVGNDTFTFAAWDGQKNSGLGTGTVAVAQGPVSIASQPYVPPTAPAGWPASFGVVAIPSNIETMAQHLWDFGDGSPGQTNPFIAHVYPNAGSFTWKVISSVQSGLVQASVTNMGTILVTGPETLQVSQWGNQLTFSWPRFDGDALLEWSPAVGPVLHWTVETNLVNYGTNPVQVIVPNPGDMRFYRLRKL